MRIKKSDEPKKLKLPSGNQARYLIEAQMAAFLNSGGKVKQIPNGVSGHKDGIRQTLVVVEKKPARAKG